MSPTGPNHLKSTTTSNFRVFVNESSSILCLNKEEALSIMSLNTQTTTIPLFSSLLLYVPPRPPAHQLSLGVVPGAL